MVKLISEAPVQIFETSSQKQAKLWDY
jgi:hypothetical protein